MAFRDFLVAQGDLRQRMYNIDRKRKEDAYNDVLKQIQLNQLTRQEEIAKIEHTYNKAISEYKSNNTEFLIEADNTRRELENLQTKNLISQERLKQELYPMMSANEMATAKLDNAFLTQTYVDKVFKNRATAIKGEILSKYVDSNGMVNLEAAKQEMNDRRAELERLAKVDTDEAKIQWINKKAEYMAGNLAVGELAAIAAKSTQVRAAQNGANVFDVSKRKKAFNDYLKTRLSSLKEEQTKNLPEDVVAPSTVDRILEIGTRMNDKSSDERRFLETEYPLVVEWVNQNYDGDFTKYMTGLFGGGKPIYRFGSKEDEDFKYLEASGQDIIGGLKTIDNEIKSMYKRIGKTTSDNPYEILRKIGNKLDNKRSTEYKQLKAKNPAAVGFIESEYGGDNPFSNYVNDIIQSIPYFETVEAIPDDFEANIFRDKAIEQLSSFEHSLTQSVDENDVREWYNKLSAEERIEITEDFGVKVKDTLLNKISRQFEDEGIVASGVFDMMWQRAKQQSSKFVDFISTLHLDDSIVSDEVIRQNDAAIKYRMRSLPQEVINDLGETASEQKIKDEIGKRLFVEFGEEAIKSSSYGSVVYSYPEPNDEWDVDSEDYYNYLLNKNIAGAITPEERRTLKSLSLKRFIRPEPLRRQSSLKPIAWRYAISNTSDIGRSYIEMNNKMKQLMTGE